MLKVISVGSREQKKNGSQSHMYNWTRYLCGKSSFITLGNSGSQVITGFSIIPTQVPGSSILILPLPHSLFKGRFIEHSSLHMDYV